MTDYTEEEINAMVDDILNPAATDSATTRLFTCRKCGNDFWSTKKKPSMCPDCFRKSHLENLKKDGQSAKAKPKAEKPPAPPEPAPPDPEPEPEQKPKRERYLTLGLLRRLLDDVDDRAVITIDGVPVTTFYVEHSYNLEDGEDDLCVALG